MLGYSSFKKGLLSSAAIAIIGAAGLTATPNQADASAFAYSALTVSGMELRVFNTDANGGGFLGGIGELGGFTTFNFTLPALSVQLGTSSLVSTEGPNDLVNPGNPGFTLADGRVRTGELATSGASIDQAQLCLVDCTGFTNNTYLSDAGGGLAAPVIVGGGAQFAVSDSNMLGTVLNGTSTFGTQAGARSNGGGTLASGTVNDGTLMNWNFSVSAANAGRELDLTWFEDRFVQVETTLAGESAEARLDFRIRLRLVNTGGGSIFDIEDLNGGDGVDQITFPSNDPTTNTGVNDFAELVTSDRVVLEEGDYELLFDFSSFAEATSPIPEPAAIGLLGAGLFGLGAIRYRRRRELKA